MEIPIALRNLAESLKYSQSPYNLLLTSTISLTPEVLKEICGSDQWDMFGQRLRERAYTHRINLLERHLSGHRNVDGYQSLVRLIEKRFFSTVLTTNLDSTLEDMLSKSSSTYRALVVGRDRNEHIANALDSGMRDIRIIKLYGSLRDEVLSETYPDFIELKETITSGLTRYINQDIVIIGSIEREDDIARLLIKSRGSIYYAVPDIHLPNDNVTRMIRGRGYDPDNFVIYGYFGQFERFCKTLDSLIPNPSNVKHKEISFRNQRAQAPVPAEIPRIDTPLQSPELVSPPTQLSVEERKPVSSTSIQPQEKETSSISSMVLKIVSGVLAIGALLAAVSLFINLTPSFNSAFIIPLIIILAVIILGIMGILRADQIVQIFLQGLTVKGSNDTPDKTEEKSTGTSTPAQPSLPPTSIQATTPSTPRHEQVPVASNTDGVLQKEIEQPTEPTERANSEAAFPPTQKPENRLITPNPDTLEARATLADKELNGGSKEPSSRTTRPPGIVRLPPNTDDDPINLANQYYASIMRSKGSAHYAYEEVFAEGKVVSGSQYDLFINFLYLTSEPVHNLLEIAERFPDDIKSLRYPLVEALHDIVVIVDSLEGFMNRDDRASLRWEIQSDFKALSDDFVKVEEAFDKLGIKGQDNT